MNIVPGDREILRALAKKVAEIGHQPVQKEKAKIWTRHNDLDPVRPMVLIFPEGSWRELLPERDLKTSKDCPLRGIEKDFRRRIYYWEHMQDDNVIEPVVACRVVIDSTGWGLAAERTNPAEATGAGHFEPVLQTEADIAKIKPPQITVDWEQTQRKYEQMQDLFGDILTVEIRGRTRLGTAPMDTYSQLRGLDQMFLDLVDNPDFVHKTMSRLMDGTVGEIRQLEEQNALSLNNRNHYVGSGGVGYTTELPQEDFDEEHIRPMDMWGFATAQIFSEVSPGMHVEFALKHEVRLLELCGLNCYGCCEPLHNKLDMVKSIPNIRRISISPWADIEQSAEELGADYIFSWKPNPAVLAAENWNPEAVRSMTKDFLEKTRGCVTEIIMKDTHTCRDEPQRMWEWTRITRELAEDYALY